MDFIERHKDIEQLLQANRKVSVEELAQRFNLSEVTIRKDLTQLENRGILLRTHGGAVLAEKPEAVVGQHRRLHERLAEKNHIAKLAAQRVKEGETILIDTGSTAVAFARELCGRNVTVVTNSILIAMELIDEDRMTVLVLGGTLRHSSLALMGAMALIPLSTLRVDRAFMGASGFDLAQGFSCENLIEAETKHAMLKTATEVVLLADHTKFDNPSFAHFCSLDEADVVVTDAALSDPVTAVLKKHNVEILVAQS